MDRQVQNAEVREAWLNLSQTSEQAARSLGMTRKALARRAKKMGLPPRRPGRPTLIVKAILVPLWRANVRVSDIADLFKCPTTSVTQAARRYKLPQRTRGRHILISLDEYRQQLIKRQKARQARKEADARRKLDARPPGE